ncbi:MAG: glycosyltransferase family 4 protein [Calditrichia bacterium]
MTYLENFAPVHRHVIDEAFQWSDLEPVVRRHAQSGKVVHIVDSLLVQNRRFIDELNNWKSTGPFILLVHYLSLLNPQLSPGKNSCFESEILKFFSGFIVTSQFSKNRLQTFHKGTSPIAVIHPGLDEFYFTPLKERPKPYPTQLLTVSSTLPEKGLIEFLTVLQKIDDLHWSWELIGEKNLDPTFTREFQTALKRHRFRNRVQVVGPLSEEDVFQKYESSDLFILPSKFESCGMVVMEALARGLPVVAFRVGGIAEICEGHPLGLLVDEGDFDRLATLLRKLLTEGILLSPQTPALGKSGIYKRPWKMAAKEFYDFINELVK